MSITQSKKIKLAKAVKKFCYKYDIVDSTILAGLVVAFDKKNKQVRFRFFVIY